MSLVSDEETEAQKGFIEDGVRTRIWTQANLVAECMFITPC
jgi:hypothetical protein